MSFSKSPPTIVFDAVGTLIFARPTVADVYHKVATQFGWTGSVVELKQRFTEAFALAATSPVPHHTTNESEQKSRWRKLVGSVFAGVAYETVDAIFAQLWQHFAQSESWEIYPDAAAAIRLCDQRGIPWCIGSNFDARLQRVVAGHALLKGAHRVFCSSQVGFDKPATEFFRHIEQELEIESQQLVMIGDDLLLDVQAAKSAGWTGVWIDRTDAAQQLDTLIAQVVD